MSGVFYFPHPCFVSFFVLCFLVSGLCCVVLCVGVVCFFVLCFLVSGLCCVVLCVGVVCFFVLRCFVFCDTPGALWFCVLCFVWYICCSCRLQRFVRLG